MLYGEARTSTTLIIPALFYCHFVQFCETLDLVFKQCTEQFDKLTASLVEVLLKNK